ncbi:MAG: hypothetical protein M0R76_06310 [Proteobacteria bacterium]|nr:hypothetical protein [Pseudomonadota bacterium]
MKYKYLANLCLGVFVAAMFAGCWDEVVHVYDNDCNCADDREDGNGTAAPDTTPAPKPDADATDSDSADANDTATDDTETLANPLLSAAWQGFGSGCTQNSDCRDYPAENKACLQDVLGMINAPGGYCTACCNEAGKDKCAPGIDCVGVDGAYLICLERCREDAHCRQDEHWECRNIPYIDAVFTDTYCLPTEAHSDPDPNKPPSDPDCPWPWTFDK